MTKRRALALLLLIVAIAVPQFAGAGKGGDRPDIVVVMVDDLGAIDERILERLPNIKRLFLEQGLRFDQAYAETPLCCPGRASFLTGQHTRRHGVTRNRARLLDDSHTIATALHDAGYWTIFAGKYLNHPEQLADKTPDGWDRVAMLNSWSGDDWSSWWIQGDPLIAGYHDRRLTYQATRWLHEAPSNKPVFMWLTPRAPHEAGYGEGSIGNMDRPWRPEVEPRYANDSRCNGIEPWKPANYAWTRLPNGFPLKRVCQSLLTVDEMVGRVRDQMEYQGRNPLWVFMSDNGMAWGADGYPLKNVPQAGRIPMYFAGPGVAQGSTDALVSNIDIGPTLAQLGGADMSFADGESFRPLLRGEPGGREWMLEDHPRGGYDGYGFTGPWWGIRTRDWHLVEWGEPRLYDLHADPFELVNVYDSHAAEAHDLRQVGVTAIQALK